MVNPPLLADALAKADAANIDELPDMDLASLMKIEVSLVFRNSTRRLPSVSSPGSKSSARD